MKPPRPLEKFGENVEDGLASIRQAVKPEKSSGGRRLLQVAAAAGAAVLTVVGVRALAARGVLGEKAQQLARKVPTVDVNVTVNVPGAEGPRPLGEVVADTARTATSAAADVLKSMPPPSRRPEL